VYPTITALILDAVLVVAGILCAAAAWKGLRGGTGVGIAIAGAGLVILGFAHLSETLMWLALDMSADSIELIHRVLVLSGFGLLVIGVTRTGRELHREWENLLLANAALIVAEEDLRLANEELRERNHQLLAAVASPSQGRLRVVIAEEKANLRRVLASTLADEPHIEIVGEARSGQELGALVGMVSPHVLLVDESMATRELIAELNGETGSRSVIVLGSYATSAFDALAAGAADYILKDAGRDRLVRAIQAAFPGKLEVDVDAEIRK